MDRIYGNSTIDVKATIRWSLNCDHRYSSTKRLSIANDLSSSEQQFHLCSKLFPPKSSSCQQRLQSIPPTSESPNLHLDAHEIEFYFNYIRTASPPRSRNNLLTKIPEIKEARIRSTQACGLIYRLLLEPSNLTLLRNELETILGYYDGVFRYLGGGATALILGVRYTKFWSETLQKIILGMGAILKWLRRSTIDPRLQM